MTPTSDARSVTQQSQSNFAPSFFFLPRDQQRGLTAIYAYCRLTDDIVDLAPDAARAQIEVDRWRKMVREALAGTSESPVLQELKETAQKFNVPHDLFFLLIDGVEMDLRKKNYATFAELYEYCYHVASVVGLMCLPVFGAHAAPSRDYAVNLGLAFQLTNILRDIRTDAERGRVYIPDEDLQRFGLSAERIIAGGAWNAAEQKNLAALINFETARAEDFYRKAEAAILPSERKPLLAAELMAVVYHAILKRIEREPLLPLREKARLPKWEIAARMLGRWLSNRLGF